ncbi:Uncharacterized protein OBRU01_02571 [Operophtera brumata]|uniref:Uncharacterized protein n=1 Tax=Operophtera brumata TaxID=104452 RepID=A0A0L7LRK3_OPEBR|nr:Uncharacterized protein OBRU01_02571 [Operophtera brumata]
MARIVPYAAIQFTAHEQCKKALRVDDPVVARQHPLRHLLAGSLAGVISQSATYPLDMARARMAVTHANDVCCGGAAGALAQSASYPLDIVRRRMQTARRRPDGAEGMRGFFKGLSMNWVKGPIAVGISFATYDIIRSTLRDVAVSVQR